MTRGNVAQKSTHIFDNFVSLLMVGVVIRYHRGDIVSTQAEKNAVLKYQRARDNIMIRPTKEEGQQIRQAAADAGQSVQQYILDTLRKRREAEEA